MIIIVSYDIRRRGGIERLTLQVRNSLAEGGKDVIILCAEAPLPGLLGRQIGRILFLIRLVWYIPRSELILCMHALLLRPIRLILKIQRSEKPILCWVHGVEVWGEHLRKVQTDLLACDQLIASSHYTRNQIYRQKAQWPITHVINPMADLMDPNELPTVKRSGFTFLTVARMEAKERYKGHRLIIEALTQLKKEGVISNNWQWRIVGDGNDSGRLQQEVQTRQLDPWIQFVGGISDAQLRQELRECSLLVMPSRCGENENGAPCGEGFGIVYLEAAVAGRASIACNEGGQTDLILNGQTGWLIGDDSRELAQLLLYLSQNPNEVRAIGLAARERALSHFGKARFSEQVMSSLIT